MEYLFNFIMFAVPTIASIVSFIFSYDSFVDKHNIQDSYVYFILGVLFAILSFIAGSIL